MLGSFYTSTSKTAFCLGSNDFKNVQIRLIFKSLAHNKSLATLSANRKGLLDEDFEELCQSLQHNTFLEKLELEYNRLTHGCLTRLGAFLKQNETIKNLSLEGNTLVEDNKDESFATFCDALKANKTLLFLNLAGTKLKDAHGKLLLEALRENKSLIMVHLQGNALAFDTIRKIQECLIENRKQFEKERRFETEERQSLRREMNVLDSLNATMAAKEREIQEMKAKVEQRQLQREGLFLEEQIQSEETDFRTMKRLEKEATTRLTRKKRRLKP